MWGDTDPDAGGSGQSGNESQSAQQLSDLKDENEQQLLLINQLKEMLRKEQSSVSQEKVEEYVNTLNKVKAKRSKQKKNQLSSSSLPERSPSSLTNIDVTKKERLNLLRQQLEENKIKLAERGKSQKGIKEMVTQFQAQFNDSQALGSIPLSLTENRNLTYNENTSQKELYNILLTKEKDITELLNKTQNFESAIVDLQENLKEKDSVIDARTKAITLMTESLSKKGKSTLDDLEERKEQMRRMQESFVALESEMKARQLTLLNDLKLKNFEITDLQQLNDELKEEKHKLEQQVTSGNSVHSLKSDIDRLSNENATLKEENKNNIIKLSNLEEKLVNLSKKQAKSSEDENCEILKLKKQLEESNKNMIKMKATHKNQTKQLNKQLNQYKKMNDSNSLIAQLQSDIVQLTEKITNLEEDKGNLQLKIIESNSDLEREVENKSVATKEQLIEKDKIIDILEAEVLSLKNSLTQNSEEQAKIYEQVSNEMNLIQYEEQIDRIELEKKQLKVENDELLEKNEILQKEKQELMAKLDNYVQENMELIDKLEKLSAEKVSSVESIEIVEGLTQQEKIELAAYQKNLGPEESLKSQENSPEPPTDLSETILQFNEDTAELLQKIEMFTLERNEVMRQMDSIRNENNSLVVKIKDLEINKNVLEETYEQLYNEKEKLFTEKQQLLKKLVNIQQVDENDESHADVLDLKLKTLQTRYDDLLKENDKLKGTLTNFEHNTEKTMRKLNEILEENSNLKSNLQHNLEEIKTYHETIETNKTELIKSSNLINDLNNKLSDRDKKLEEFNENIQDLYTIIETLQRKTNNYEKMESELNEFEKGIAFHSETIHKLNDELILSNNRLTQYENDLIMKDGNIHKLTENIVNSEGIIRNLEKSIEEKDIMFRRLNEEMKEKYIELQHQLKANEQSLQVQVNELNNKNKDQLEKMKKIAANLKKKSQAYQDVQEQYSNEKTRWENELKEKNTSIATFEERITSLIKKLKDMENQLKVKTEESEFLQNEISRLKQHANDLEREIMDQQNYILELKQEKLSEISLQQEISASLHSEEVEENFSKNLSQEKIRELELLLETNESELNYQKHRLERYEENARRMEEAKSVLEVKNVELENNYSLILNDLKEKNSIEEQMKIQFAEIRCNSEILSAQLQEALRDREQLSLKNQENDELIKKLKIKLKKSHEKVSELRQTQDHIQEIEHLNEVLKNRIASLEANQQHIQHENESLQKRNMSDYEKIEADYQIQLEELLKVQGEINVEKEKLLEKVKNLEVNEQELRVELEEYKMKFDENENQYKQQINQLNEELRQFEETMKTKDLNAKKLANDLNESSTEIQKLLEENDQLKKSISNLDEFKIQLELVQSEKDRLHLSLLSSNDKLEQCMTEKANLQRELNLSIEKLAVSKHDIENLRNKIDLLENEIQALEFAKSALEASYDSTQKLKEVGQPSDVRVLEDFQESQLKSSEAAIPTFQWNEMNQQQSSQAELFDSISVNSFAVLKETENLENLHESTNIISAVNTEQDTPTVNISLGESERELLFKQFQTLEYVVHNLHQEKDNLIEQLNVVKNKLANREVNQQQNESTQELELQVLNQDEIDKLATDKWNTEFSDTKSVVSNEPSPVAVQEDTVQPKKAYLCFDIDENLPQKSANLSDVDSHMLWQKDVSEMASSKKELEFQLVDQIEPQNQQQKTVVEPPVHTKRAYLCYTNDGKRKSIDAFEENDDGWAWGPEEAILEEEHLSNLENIPQVKHILLEISQLKDNIQVLQVERENHLEEIRQLQVKSGKLIKKCRELKSKCDNKVQDDFGLNETIEEEMKMQISQLEKKISEISIDHEKEKGQREKLAKRVQELIATNEKLVETKQIVDSEVLRLQRKFDNVVEKLKKYEWGEDGFGNEEKTLDEAKSIESLPISKPDQDELNTSQSAEEKDLLDELSKQKIIVEEKNKIINQLQQTLNALNSQKVDLEEMQSKFEKIENHLKVELNKLSFDLINKNSTITELNSLIETLKSEKEILEQSQEKAFAEVAVKDEELKNQIKELEQNKEIVIELQKKISDMESLYSIDAKVKAENSQLIQNIDMKSQEIEESKKLVEQLQTEKESLQKNIGIINQLNIELNTKQLEIEKLTVQLDSQAKQSEEKTSALINELNENCQIRIDQRGSEVAESWKLYLENVEKDYQTIQEQLKNNISELEEKYNNLITENDELRKNVDQERNIEVNRIVELQQQIKDNQQHIKSLNLSVKEKEQLLEKTQSDLAQYSSLKLQIESLKIDNEEKETKLNNINIVIEATQKQFDEKREVIEEIVAILEKNTTAPISYEKHDVLKEFQRQLNLNNDKNTEIIHLTDKINSLETNLKRIIGEKDREIQGLNQVIEDLQIELSVVHERDAEIIRLTNELKKFNDEKEELVSQLRINNDEKASLQQLVEKSKEAHVKCQSIMDDHQDIINRFHSAQETLEKQNGTIKELQKNIEDIREMKINDSNKEIEFLNQELTSLKEDYMILQESFSDNQLQLHDALAEVNRKSQELITVNQFLLSCQQITSESNEKVQLLSEKITAINEERARNLEFEASKVDEIHRDYKELISNKDHQIEQLNLANRNYSDQLNQENELKQKLEQQLLGQTQLVNEDTKQLEELKLIIEEQVARIEELKKELYGKSNQYDSLIAEMDVGRQPVTQQPSKHNTQHLIDNNLSDPVNRAELDVALYMLHQRDVRCEELTVELTQLLEERDTLQLKLSNSIREKEELKKKLAGDIPNVSNDKVITAPNDISEISASSSATELATDSFENEQVLATKLSELKSVGYKKDKTFVDEQEARRIQQYAIMQEHINDTSKLPPEAVAKLLDASYTLSRDVQSPSKVLLNWLWGKSPPKANDS